MKTFVGWLESSFAPKMDKVNNNVWISTLKDSMMQLLPLILVGSMVTMLAILQDFFPNVPNFWSIYNYTMGLLGILVAFLVPFNYMERIRLRKLRIVAGMTGFAMFAIMVHMDNPELFDFGTLGAGGMFVAIVVGIISGIIFSLFGKFSFFKEDSAMPDFVRQWFDNMLPVGILIFGTWTLVNMAGFDLFAFILMCFSPLANFAESLYGFVFIYFLWCFFYSMGISTWMMWPISGPIMIAGITANMALLAQGLPATYINTNEVFGGWIGIGGTGATLFLVLFMVFSKSKRLKALGKASLVPSVLNINEPVFFGAIVWNPVMMIPVWLHGILAPMIIWLWFRGGLTPIPGEVFNFWYIPHPIQTLLISRTISGMVLFAILCIVNIVIYYPFFKVYEQQQVNLEKVAAEV